jgi:hypothetical protein
MSKKQIILLAIMAVADLCVLGLGAFVVLSGQRASPVVKPFALPTAAASATPPPTVTSTASAPPSATPTPTETHWPTWTPRPSKTPFPSNTPISTDTPTTMPTSTRRPTSTSKPGAGSGSGGPTGGGAKGTTAPGSATCDMPGSGEPVAGKLEAAITHISWRQAPDNPDYAIGTIEIGISGGDGCYKYELAGQKFNRRPLEFRMNRCGAIATSLTITSADGQVWKQDLIVSADDPSFKCK